MAFDGVDYSLMRSYLQMDLNRQNASQVNAMNQANNFANQQATRANQFESLSNHLFSRVKELRAESYDLQKERYALEKERYALEKELYETGMMNKKNFKAQMAYRSMIVSLFISALINANFSKEEIDNRDFSRLWGDLSNEEIDMKLDEVFNRGLVQLRELITGKLKHPRTQSMFDDRENNKEEYSTHLAKGWEICNNEFIPTKETFMIVSHAMFSGFYNSGLPLDIDCGDDILKSIHSSWGL